MSSKTKNIIAWVLSVLLALIFIMSGITKLFGVEMQLQNIESWGYPLWSRFPIGAGEIVLAAGILIPSYRKLTIYGIFIWTVVAVVTHLRVGQNEMIIAPVIISVIALAVLLLQRSKGS